MRQLLEAAATPELGAPNDVDEAALLRDVEARVLWLGTAMVHHANQVRVNDSRLKVGGHQASSASMVTLMTTLWFRHLTARDRVSVKPHASPVLHALNYLTGALDQDRLTTLRQFGGLQSYPSRTKDPDPVDYSTGSVGIGATAPLWGALSARYVHHHFGADTSGRQYSLLGDAELDEGACWEAVLDPQVAQLGEVVWVVDVNRQSLDRVVPTLGVDRFVRMFDACGWQVIQVKYGSRLQAAFQRPGGEALRRRLDEMSNGEYQRLLRAEDSEARERLCGQGEERLLLHDLLRAESDAEVHGLVRDLGGHDPAVLSRAFDSIDDDRPTIVFAYTVKGNGLASQGHPQNHSALLNHDQMDELAVRLGVDPADPWAAFPEGSAQHSYCRDVSRRLTRPLAGPGVELAVPADLGRPPASGTATTQAALGRLLLDVNRAAPELGRRVVTVSPDVSSSTNLGGWVNKVGVWSATPATDWFADDGETILHWKEGLQGRHIELGIAETNLVGLLGELGATGSRWGEPLVPIGVVYDPFVERALEPWSFGLYAGGRSILVGTPSGVSLAAEGGAHQSIKTPSIGLEQPGCTAYEPAFVIDTEWILLEAMRDLLRPDGASAYLRLSTRPVDQKLAAVPTDPAARETRRRQVVAGAYALRRAAAPRVAVCAVGAVVPEALAAATRLEALGIEAEVICVTSADLVFRALQGRRGLAEWPTWVLDSVFPAARACPMVTVLDGHPHTLCHFAEINQVPVTHLGVTRFGQSGDLASVYRHHGLDADAIVAAALELLS